MKRLLFALALVFAVGNVYAADLDGLADKLFAPETVPLKLTDFGLNGAGKPSFQANDNPASVAENLNPGKALLLSAILPGAGELYAGSKLKAGIFFAVEVAAWTGVILFYNKGKDKEDEFMEFADANFNEDLYRQEEFRLAQDPTQGDTLVGFSGGIEDWTTLPWETKIHFLPREGFTHELPTRAQRDAYWSYDQQYYEMIGKYIHQFGFGWLDGYGNTDEFPYFSGSSPNSLKYMGMRDDSNKFLDYSAWGYNIALLNHVASALDASFTVRFANRRAKAQLSFRQVPYDGELAKVAGLTFTW